MDFEQFAASAATDLPKKIWLRGGHLDRAEEWLKKGLTENWAQQYRGDYGQAGGFIRLSLKHHGREMRRAWYVAGAFAGVALVAAVAAHARHMAIGGAAGGPRRNRSRR
jgi:hypothetical protein